MAASIALSGLIGGKHLPRGLALVSTPQNWWCASQIITPAAPTTMFIGEGSQDFWDLQWSSLASRTGGGISTQTGNLVTSRCDVSEQKRRYVSF